MQRALIVASALCLIVSCATITPEARLRNEIFWDAAVECESRHHTLHLDQIDSDGNVTMHADAESRHQLRPFIECYQKGVQARVAKRRQAGLPVPDTLNLEPTAEVD